MQPAVLTMKGISELSTRRDTTIDIAKGIAIIAIVFGHIHRGMWASGLGTEALRPYKFMLDYGGLFLAPGSFRFPERPFCRARSNENYPLLIPDEASDPLRIPLGYLAGSAGGHEACTSV